MFARRTPSLAIAAALLLVALPPRVRADSNYGNSSLSFLPPAISNGLTVGLWGWYSQVHTSDSDAPNYWDGQIAATATKSFSGNAALTTEMSFIDDNNVLRGQLEQAYLSVVLSKNANSYLTVGKFNANFGVEPRDFWYQQDGTTSLLFSAQPQDLIGVMLTYPVPDSHVKLEPFLATGFTGSLNMPTPPSAGLTFDDQPNSQWDIALTQWIGPGFEKRYSASNYVAPPIYGYGYGPYAPAATDNSNTYYRGGADVVTNWNGPDLYAIDGGTLYLAILKAVWTPRNDVTLSAEALVASTSSYQGSDDWDGLLVMADYDLTDKWRLFGRWSLIDDSSGIVTGLPQHREELSGGIAYQIIHNAEVRAEYRHDFSYNAGDLDTVSIDLTFGI
jgi:hypothetical protein